MYLYTTHSRSLQRLRQIKPPSVGTYHARMIIRQMGPFPTFVSIETIRTAPLDLILTLAWASVASVTCALTGAWVGEASR